MQKYAILAQVEKDKQMEAEFQQLREEQEHDLREIEQARREMETAIEEALRGKPTGRWHGHPNGGKDRIHP
jgi:hypothetical protein